jgi:hypothetical protein
VRPLTAGAIRVEWHTVSADGDPIQGQFGFTVAPTAAPTNAVPSPVASSPTAPSPAAATPSASRALRDTAHTESSTPSPLVWAGITVAAVVIAGLAGGALWWRRRQH